MDSNRLVMALGIGLGFITVVGIGWNLGTKVVAGQGTAQPPTAEPGWVAVGDQQEIRFPDGATVILGDQSQIPPARRIVWVRHEEGAGPPPPRPLPPPRP